MVKLYPPQQTVEAGSIDLGNCDREPIHELGAIQPFGFLLAVSAQWTIDYASSNVSRWLGPDARDLIGKPLGDALSAEAEHAIRNRLQSLRGGDSVERVFALPLSRNGDERFDVAVYLSGSTIVIEAEPSVSEPDLNSGSLVRSMISRLNLAESFTAFCREGARQVRMLSGFDRVMIYKFNVGASGEVIAEAVRGGVESFFGLRYPASDIPSQARALYLRNSMRIIADVAAEPVPLLPQRGTPLDLSLSGIRSVSPIHIEYLKNMGVAASMSISIVVRGKLWGLIACHHLAPRYLSFERRIATELFGQMFSLLLESREREEEADQEAQARAIQNKILASIANEGASLQSLGYLAADMREMVRCDGIGITLGDGVFLHGLTPTKEEFLGVVRMLNQKRHSTTWSTQALSAEHGPAADFPERAAGLLAIPLSRMPRDYIVFFRREVAQTVNWAGNPQKPAELGPNGIRLTPRKSFEMWREVVRGESEPWSELDLRVAESLRMTLLDVVLRMSSEAENERKTSNERQELLIAELNHRVRNILGLVKGLLAQTSTTGSVEEFAQIVAGRVQALARAHDQITTDDWQPAPLKALIRAEGEAYLVGKGDRIRIDGEDVLIAPQAFSTMALVIHELMTNSAKYGALCDRSGWVTIKWRRDNAGNLVLDWREQGGPPVRPPTRRGFGSTIIERSIPFDLKGEAQVEYALEGLKARFTLPSHLIMLGKATTPERFTETVTGEMAGFVGPMLLAEDNMIIALDAEDALHDIGIGQVISVSSVEDGLRYLDKSRPEAAVLDFNLGSETSIGLAEKLSELNVPFFFATGYGEMLKLPTEFASHPVVKKPYNADSLRSALAACLQRQ